MNLDMQTLAHILILNYFLGYIKDYYLHTKSNIHFALIIALRTNLNFHLAIYFHLDYYINSAYHLVKTIMWN